MESYQKDLDKYNKRCDIIKSLILKKYTDTTFEFITNPDTSCIEVIINNNSKISLLPDNTWQEVERHINTKIIGFTGDCPICYEKKITSVSCAKCSNDFCGKCYIKLFMVGKGIITCPHCRDMTGQSMPEHMIEQGVYTIKKKLGQY